MAAEERSAGKGSMNSFNPQRFPNFGLIVPSKWRKFQVVLASVPWALSLSSPQGSQALRIPHCDF